MPLQQSLPPEWKRRLERELEQGEEVIWTGQPDPSMAAVRHLLRIAKYMAVLLFFEVFLVLMTVDELRRGDPVWRALFLLLGAALIILPLLALWQRHQARRTLYALTSHRALVYLPAVFGTLNPVSYFPNQLEKMRFAPAWFFGPDAGDVVLDARTRTKIITTTTTQGPPQPSRVEVMKSVKVFGFLMLRAARHIETLIDEKLLAPRRKAERLR